MARVMIGPGGEIVLPAALLTAVGLEAGDALQVSLGDGALVLTPEPHDLIEATYGMARPMWSSVGGSAAFVREMDASWRA
ncbi:MAG: AbrB/MazE/SpoVT family DNA-binding domain-containing protein [Chloroflexi bacterium]|nr:AbrB/MazE/SpoVT family DNA-binding domain-containing protein [Chloroflexota bacterium]